MNQQSKSKSRRILWIVLGAVLLIAIVFVILIACGVFRNHDRSAQPAKGETRITVPTEIENQKTGGVMQYSYNLEEKSLTVRVKGNVEVPFCFPFLPSKNITRQNLSFAAFNCFDYSPAVILSFCPMILSGKIDTVHFDGSMTWDAITYRFHVDESRRVSDCQVEQNGDTTNLLYDYDSNGRLLSVGDQKGYTFDIIYAPGESSRISRINIMNRSTAIQNELQFTGSGQIRKMTYRGIKTGKTIVAEFTYHRNGMIRTEDVLNIHSRFSYDSDGLLTHPKYNRNSLIIDYSEI